MNENEKIFDKLNEVFKLIFYSKLKDDVDDSLLQKLLTSVQLESAKHGHFVNEMIEHTQIEEFLTEVLRKNPQEMDWEAVSFSLQLLTSFENHQDIINLLKKERMQLLSQLMNVFQTKNLPLMSFSVKVAGLNCFTILAKEEEQFLLLFKNGIIKAGIHCLAEESLYVQKSAVKFVSTCMLTAQGISRQNTANENTVLEEPFELIMAEILAQLHSTSEVPKCNRSRKLFMSAVDVLKSFFEMKSEYDVTPIASIISNVIRAHLRESDIDEIYLNKLLELLSVIISPWKQNIYSLSEITESLLRKQQLPLLLHFISSSLMRYEEQLSSDMLDIFLLPVTFLSNSDNIQKISIEFKDCLHLITKNKASTLKLISFSISCLSNISNKMNKKQQKKVSLCMLKVLSLTTQQSEKSVLLGYVYGSHKLQIALITFLASNLEWLELTHEEEILNSIEILINTTENSSSNSMVTDKCMQIISRFFETWHKLHTSETKKQDFSSLKNLAMMLQKRLLDPNWEVIDSCLTLVNAICRCYKVFIDVYFITTRCVVDLYFITTSLKIRSAKPEESSIALDTMEWLCSYSLHTSIWDMISSDYYDGYVKANALCTIATFLVSPVGWGHLQINRNLVEQNVILLFCKSLLCDSDTFVHREAVKAMSLWIQHRNIPEEFCKALCIAIVSDLDWEVKILALETWKLILKKDCFLKYNDGHIGDVQKSLEDICQCGFAFAVTSALNDHDKSVQNIAANILSDMSSHFQTLKIEKFQLDLPDKIADNAIHNKDNITASTGEDSYSKESREAIIEHVLDIGTDEQIYEKCTPVLRLGTDIHVENILQNSSLLMDSNDFLQVMCSKNLKEIITESEKSTDLYADNFESLLDDIISSSASETEHQAMDCY